MEHHTSLPTTPAAYEPPRATGRPSLREHLHAGRRHLLALLTLAPLAGAGRAQTSRPPELPLRITSSESGGELRGAVRAVSEFPFAAVSLALGSPENWCEILMLHLNNKACQLDGTAEGHSIKLAIARKHDQPPQQANTLALQWRLREAGDRLVVRLDAAVGPFGTTDYVVELIASPVGSRTAIEFSYGCRFGTGARLGMQAYMSTLGRDKVGFSMLPASEGSRLVGGLRGVIERTAVRYYLAIDAWLHAMSAPDAQRSMRRLEHWFDATERYPRQLHEMDKPVYLAQKRRELGLPE